VDADWIPNSETLAVVRDPGGGRPWTVEFPAGTIVHETRAAWSLRVSPDGTRLAFFDGPILFEQTPVSTITVVDRSGRKSTVARNVTGIGLAWAPGGDEIWFTATTPGNHPQLRATTLAGVERTVVGATDWLVLHDIAADGRVLSVHNGLSCQSKADAGENDLEWTRSSMVSGLSDDGTTVVFSDRITGLTPAGNPSVFLRRLDGSAAIPLGEGWEPKLSPDGKWALVGLGGTYSLLPTGTGPILKLGKGDLGRLLGAAWFPDSKRIAFAAIPPGDTRARGYIQEIPDGIPRAITPRAVYLSGKTATVRDDHSVLGLAEAEDRWTIYSLNGAASQVIPGLTGRDIPIQWSPDGRFLYLYTAFPNRNAPLPPAFDVFQVEVANGRRTLWKSLQPQNPVGVESWSGTIVMTRNAGTYCYSYLRRVGDLFVVDGLK
jgi:eukaryotic-like serine/threonine-protein kinase